MKEYRAILAEIDAWYAAAKRRFPAQVPCEIGCRECCLGLFEITPADRELLLEGLAALDPEARADIESRAERILGKLRETYPDLADSLEGYTPQEAEELSAILGPVECPVLGPKGECRLYHHRPLVCRLAGLPVVDPSGEVVATAGCSRCTLSAREVPKLECRRLRREEDTFLRSRYADRAGITFLLPQALTRRASP